MMIFAAIWLALGVAYAGFCLWLGVRVFNRRERWAKRTAVAMAILPVLYALSSGPMKMITWHKRVTVTPTILPDGTSGNQASTKTDFGEWFSIAYAPLVWAFCYGESWGEPVNWYWELFPDAESDAEA
jgi:hypothetical protein